MTSALVEQRAPSLFDALEPERTLDDAVAAAWAKVSSHRTADCLLCGGEMQPVYGAHASPIGARCTSCATTLV